MVPSLDTPVCDAQTKRFKEEAGKLPNVSIYTFSMDLPFAQKRWCGAFGVDHVKMVSDHRTGSFGEAYGTLIKDLRIHSRAIFVVDKNNNHALRGIREGSGRSSQLRSGAGGRQGRRIIAANPDSRLPMLRIAYVCEFLLALLAITVVWGQVGGQDHLDLMPWYDKLVLTFALALVTVLGTVAAVSRERAWNGVAIACLAIAILIAVRHGRGDVLLSLARRQTRILKTPTAWRWFRGRLTARRST